MPPTDNRVFEKKLYISKYHKFAFSGQVSLKMIVESLKYALCS